MTETYAVRWVVDSGHAWLEVPLDEAIYAARDVRPVSGFSYVDERAGFAYLEEDRDAGVWLEWVAGSDDLEAIRAVAVGVEGFHHCDGPAWVRDLPSWDVAEVGPASWFAAWSPARRVGS